MEGGRPPLRIGIPSVGDGNGHIARGGKPGALREEFPAALGHFGPALVVALVPGPLAVVLAFPAVSYMIAAVFGVGIGYAQDMDPAHPGLAGGIYFVAQGVGITVGGALIAAAEGTCGLPHAFLGPALAILCGGAGILFTRPRREVIRKALPAATALAGE